MRGLRSFALWWVALFGAFLLFQGDLARADLIAAAGAGVVGAALAEVLRARGLLRMAVPLDALGTTTRVPLQVVVDFGIVTWALLRTLAGRPVHGRFVRRPEVPADRRAFVGVIAAYSPNAYPIELGEEGSGTLVHDLIRNRKSEEPA